MQFFKYYLIGKQKHKQTRKTRKKKKKVLKIRCSMPLLTEVFLRLGGDTLDNFKDLEKELTQTPTFSVWKGAL